MHCILSARHAPGTTERGNQSLHPEATDRAEQMGMTGLFTLILKLGGSFGCATSGVFGHPKGKGLDTGVVKESFGLILGERRGGGVRIDRAWVGIHTNLKSRDSGYLAPG